MPFAVLASLSQTTSIYRKWRGHKQVQGKEQRPEGARGREEPRGQLLCEVDRRQDASKDRPSFLPSSLAHCVERQDRNQTLNSADSRGMREKDPTLNLCLVYRLLDCPMISITYAFNI